MAYVQLLDSIIQKKQSKLAVVNVNKGKSLGNEVFKMIVEMAYEMEVADKMKKRIEDGHKELSDEMKRLPKLINAGVMFKKISKMYKLSYKNKKYYNKGDDDNDEQLEGKVYHSNYIPIAIVGEVPVCLLISKYIVSNELANACITLYVGSDFTQVESYALDTVAPSLNTSLSLRHNINRHFMDELRRKFDDIYYLTARTYNESIWKNRLNQLWRQAQPKFPIL